MRDYAKQTQSRVQYIQKVLRDAGASGVVFGNSGGKDCALVGILCKKATQDVLSVCMPCQSSVNYGQDLADAQALATQFGIESITVDLTQTKEQLLQALGNITPQASNNIAPRLRMTTLYALAQSTNRLVVGTGNKSERMMGYFTKYGDGGFDFNPISDLTVQEVYDFLAYLDAPASIRAKAPSAGLFEGQTDEKEMGISYASIDQYLQNGQASPQDEQIITKAMRTTAHKRQMPSTYIDT